MILNLDGSKYNSQLCNTTTIVINCMSYAQTMMLHCNCLLLVPTKYSCIAYTPGNELVSVQ